MAGYARRLSVKDITTELQDLGISQPINSGNSDSSTISAPSGYIYRIINLHIDADPPSGATSGTHYILLTNSNQPAMRYLLLKSNFDKEIKYMYSYCFIADTDAQPTTEAAQMNVLSNMVIEDTNGIDFTYSNDTDANQVADVDIFLFLEKIRVA